MKARVAKMTAAGMTAKHIASTLHCSTRTVFNYRARVTKEGAMLYRVHVTEPRPYEDFTEEIKACLEFSVEGFERFFDRYAQQQIPGLQPHSRRFVESALESPNVILNCPPRHAKSEIFSVWLPIWLICRDRNVQILLISRTHDLALKFTRDIAYQLEREQMVNDFGPFKPVDDSPWQISQGKLMVAGRDREKQSGDYTVMARGAQQQVYGFEADWIICDDMVTIDNTLTQDRREKLSDWFHTEVESRLEPEGRIVVVGTRFHLDDLYGELSRMKVSDDTSKFLWRHINFPAVNDWESGNVLWPQKWTVEKLHEIHDKIGAARFDQTYQQRPIPPSERTCRPEWIFGDDMHTGCLDKDRPRGIGLEGDDVVRVASLDPSPKANAGLIVADVRQSEEDDSHTICLIDVVRGRMAVRDMLSEMARLYDAYRYTHLVVEVNAAQRWLLQDAEFQAWRDQKEIRTLAHTTSRNKADEEYGIRSLSRDFEFGRIRLPWAGLSTQDMTRQFLDEALTHPYGTTDDLMMALWFIRFNLRHFTPPHRSSGEAKGFRVPGRLRNGFPFRRRAA